MAFSCRYSAFSAGSRGSSGTASSLHAVCMQQGVSMLDSRINEVHPTPAIAVGFRIMFRNRSPVAVQAEVGQVLQGQNGID